MDQRGITPDGNCTDGVSAWRNQFGYLSYDGKSYDGQCSFFGGASPLSLGDGWIIVAGISLLSAFVSALLLWAHRRHAVGREFEALSEYFSTAGRDIPTGLTTADVVSKWTWAASLLQSSNVAYKFGVSGPFWYAAGATVQLLLFSILAIEIKRKCPAVHTVLEVVMVRWGTAAHVVFLCFCLLTNLIVTAMLVLGGSAVVHALTGFNTSAACFLIPIIVSSYTLQGGLKATYFASFTHTALIFVVLLIFAWKVYVGPSDLGSLDRMWQNLGAASQKNPVEGNSGGSLLTMVSRQGLIFGLVNVVGNFGTVFVDQSYWQGAIAARPTAAWTGYLIGGLCWFAIPFTLASTLGLAARALDLPVTADEAGAGLVPAAVGLHLLGKGGAMLLAAQVLVAVAATANSEQLAVASLLAYDVYRAYVNPAASSTQMVMVSRAGVLLWAVVSGAAAVALQASGVGLGWMYMAMGNLIGSAVAPICMALLWRDCTGPAAVIAALVGLATSLAGWIGMAAQEEGGVSVETLGRDTPMLTGNLLAILVSATLAWALSAMSGGQRFRWEKMDEMTRRNLLEHDPRAYFHYGSSDDPRASLENAYSTAVKASLALAFLLLVLWPLSALPQNPFSLPYFRWWVTLALIWGHVSAAVAILFPLWDLRDVLCPCLFLAAAASPQPTEEGTPAGLALDESTRLDDTLEVASRDVASAAPELTASAAFAVGEAAEVGRGATGVAASADLLLLGQGSGVVEPRLPETRFSELAADGPAGASACQ